MIDEEFIQTYLGEESSKGFYDFLTDKQNVTKLLLQKFAESITEGKRKIPDQVKPQKTPRKDKSKKSKLETDDEEETERDDDTDPEDDKKKSSQTQQNTSRTTPRGLSKREIRKLQMQQRMQASKHHSGNSPQPGTRRKAKSHRRTTGHDKRHVQHENTRGNTHPSRDWPSR